jgi:type IV pilus assembly protein PilF
MNLLIKLLAISFSLTLLVSCTTEKVNQSTDLSEASSLNVQLGLRYLHAGNTSRAKQKLLQAVKQKTSAQSYGAMAYFYEQTSENKMAEKFYLKAIGQNSQAGAGHNNYGAFLCRVGKYAQAEQQFQLAVDDVNYTNDGSVYENAGLCALLIPDQSKAKQYFTKAVQQSPRLSNALAQLAKINYEQKQYQQANLYLQRYIKSNNVSPEFLLLGVKIAQHLRQPKLAKEYGFLLKSQFPKSKQYKQYLHMR